MIRQVLVPIISSLAKLAKAVLPYALAYKAGENGAERERAENAAKTKDKQLRAASRRRLTRGDILERMRGSDL
jgi:hypothetical protein